MVAIRRECGCVVDNYGAAKKFEYVVRCKHHKKAEQLRRCRKKYHSSKKKSG